MKTTVSREMAGQLKEGLDLFLKDNRGVETVDIEFDDSDGTMDVYITGEARVECNS